MPELDFAAWTDSVSVAGAPNIPTSPGLVLPWPDQVVRDPSFTLTVADTRARVADAGRYLVRYDFGVTVDGFAIGTKTRAQILATLRVNDVEQVWGRGLAYWRNREDCEQGRANAAAVLDLAANDEVSVHAVRTDTAGTGGATHRDASSEGQLMLWRLKGSWRTLRVKLTADAGPSDEFGQDINFGTVELAEAGWADIGGARYAFDPVAAGADYEPARDHVFLLAVTVEGWSDGVTENALEVRINYANGSGVVPVAKPIYLSTSFAEGPNDCTRAVAGWAGLIEGISGETFPNPEHLRISYRHLDPLASAFNLKAGKVSMQIVAIPRSQIEYTHAAEDAGGQAAGTAGVSVTFDSTRRETADLNHNPAGGDSSEIRALGLGCWALGFASAHARPLPL